MYFIKRFAILLAVCFLAVPMLPGCALYDQACQNMAITNKSFPDGVVGQEYKGQVTVESNCQWWQFEGRTFVEFSVTSGEFPPGVDLDPMGAIYGVPTLEGVYAFTIKANNVARFFSVRRDYSITIR